MKGASMSNYLISISSNAAAEIKTIHDPDTKLKVRAFDLLKSKFSPSKGEVSYFVTSKNETLAFETKGYNKQRKLLVLQMIAWYCIYLGLLEVQIHASLPI
jgi:hypothetical protein